MEEKEPVTILDSYISSGVARRVMSVSNAVSGPVSCHAVPVTAESDRPDRGLRVLSSRPAASSLIPASGSQN